MKGISIAKFIFSIFAFSWICWGIAIVLKQPNTTFPTLLFYMFGGSGPTLVALFTLFRKFDKTARREFWSRLIDVQRIPSSWWVLCLFVIPVLTLLAIRLDVLLGGTLPMMPNLQMMIEQPAVIPMFVIMMLIGGALSEELGWRGFVLDAFQRTWTPLKATFLLSLIWCAFHLPLFFIRGTPHYKWGFFSPMFWLFILNVIPLTVFLTLAYNHTRRSILSAVLIHFSYNLTLGVLDPVSTRAYGGLAVFLVLLDLAVLKFQGWTAQQHHFVELQPI